ncbi:MAG: HlyC/CorC family transporter [Rhodospirillales bacterium]|nr:MAG: HlyC/CorC family transporter [Rhodospirillales bacterium]
MTTNWIITSGAIFLLLIFSGFFSGSETALTAASRHRMHSLAKQGDRRAQTVIDLHSRNERLIGAILLGNNLVNIMASAMATGLLLTLFGEAGVVYATLIVTLLVVVFSEVLPKTWALNHADRTALAVATPVRILVFLLGPVTHAIYVLVRATLRLFGLELGAELGRAEAEEELRGAIDLHEGEEPETRHERQMMHSILDLDEVEVGEIMTHRRTVSMVDLDSKPDEIVDQVLESQFTRIPVYRGDSDNVVGVLHTKELLRELRRQKGDVSKISFDELPSAPWFIPDTTSLLDQLQAFRSRREHFAVVVDEYGSLMGIVTLEDILEEIVGEIEDEHDTPVRGVRPQPDGTYIVDGTVTIRDLNREFDWNLPDEEAATIAGLVLHEARLIPDKGQVFVFYGFRFEVLRRVRNQIASLRLTPPSTAEALESLDEAE